MPITDDLNRVNEGPTKDSTVTNFAIARCGAAGAGFEAAGSRNLEGMATDEHTLFGEGSIGKVRYAGLAFMMQEKEIIDLSQNAGKFFASDKMRDFLEKQYPGQGAALQERIASLFRGGGSEEATLADLTTHMAGIGDLTRAQQRLFVRDGVTKEYSIPDLLLLDDTDNLLDESGKPKAQGPKDKADTELPKGQYGAHQYSNLGYMLLGLALEQSYYQARGQVKDYKQLTTDFMLRPVEGRAHETHLEAFSETKFPHQLTRDDSVTRTPWIDRGALVDPTRFSGANAAGGMFCSASDSQRFFTEFFKGFPGTPEYGTEGVNKFFSKDTIDLMWKETLEKGRSPANQGDIDKDLAAKKEPRMRKFQGPGFVVEVDDSGSPLKYEKGGGTVGYASMMIFDCKTGVMTDLQARENVTCEVAKRSGLPVQEVMARYSAGGNFDRKSMMQDHGLVRTSIEALDLAENPQSWTQKIKQQKWERTKGSGSREI